MSEGDSGESSPVDIEPWEARLKKLVGEQQDELSATASSLRNTIDQIMSETETIEQGTSPTASPKQVRFGGVTTKEIPSRDETLDEVSSDIDAWIATLKQIATDKSEINAEASSGTNTTQQTEGLQRHEKRKRLQYKEGMLLAKRLKAVPYDSKPKAKLYQALEKVELNRTLAGWLLGPLFFKESDIMTRPMSTAEDRVSKLLSDVEKYLSLQLVLFTSWGMLDEARELEQAEKDKSGKEGKEAEGSH